MGSDLESCYGVCTGLDWTRYSVTVKRCMSVLEMRDVCPWLQESGYSKETHSQRPHMSCLV